MNKRLLYTLFTAVALLYSPFCAKAQSLVINEFMASNATVMADEDGDYEDWIELYNNSSTSINLLNYGLSDQPANPYRWQFPSVNLPAGAYLLVWASGKDRNNPDAPLHTNFSISSSGENILLTNPVGHTLDFVVAPSLISDVSSGRKPDGAAQWYYFEQSTPGQSNTSISFNGILLPPQFSQVGGFYTEDISLSLSHPDPGVQIVYTLDGSDPDAENLSGTGFPYKKIYPQHPDNPFGEFFSSTYISFLHDHNPLLITDRSSAPDSLTHKASAYFNNPYYFPQDPVFKGTVVRARAVKPNHISSPVATAVYFVNPLGRARFSLPVINISTNSSHYFDYYDGIYNPGIDFDTWRQNNPESSVSGGRPANYHRRGDEWEYPAHFAFFDTFSSTMSFGQDIGFRLHGGWSRAYPMKTLRIYARSNYDNGYLDYPIFPEQNYNSYKRLLIRNSGQDWSFTLFRDGLIQRVVGHMNFETLAFRPSVMFVNGEYWGIHNIRERYDRHYLERVFKVDPLSIDLLEGNAIVKEGDNQHYLQTLAYIQNNDISQDEHYQYILTRIDLENYMDYQIANIYAANSDWPGNNIDYWRKKTNTYQPNSPYGQDGRWRWLAFDMDFGFGYVHGTPSSNHNTLEFATQAGNNDWPNPDWSTFLLRNLLENESFRNDFINRFSDHINTTFLPERVNALITEFQGRILPEMPEHMHRWKQPEDMSTWNYHINYMRNFVNKRPHRQRGHILNHFALPDTTYVTLNVANPEQGYIKINTINITQHTPGVQAVPYPWTGIYFQGVPVTVSAIGKPGFVFSHWEGMDDTIAVVTKDPVLLAYITAHFKPDEGNGNGEEPEYRELIHYWYFNTSLPNDVPLETIQPTFWKVDGSLLTFQSAFEGYPYNHNSPFWRKASMERRNAPTPVNYRAEGNQDIPYNAEAMRGIQIKQPFSSTEQENTLIFHLPVNGYEDVIFRFAAKDEWAVNQVIADYSVNSEQPMWISTAMEQTHFEVSKDYTLFTLNFTGIGNIKNNNNFRIRLRFACDDPLADDGKRIIFNSFSLEGNPTPVNTEFAEAPSSAFILYPNPVKRDQEIDLGQTMDIFLYSIDGKLLRHQIGTKILSVEGLLPGTYILQNGKGQAAKIIVLP